MAAPVLNLDRMQIAKPCRANWDEMEGGKQVRFCGQCRQNVYDLSELSGDEARALILRHEGKLCVRFFRRRDGTVLTKDCPEGVRAARVRSAGIAAGIAAAAGLAGGLIQGLRGRQLPVAVAPPVAQPVTPTDEVEVPPPAPPPEPMMGAMVYTPEPTPPAPVEPEPEVRMGRVAWQPDRDTGEE